MRFLCLGKPSVADDDGDDTSRARNKQQKTLGSGDGETQTSSLRGDRELQTEPEIEPEIEWEVDQDSEQDAGQTSR